MSCQRRSSFSSVKRTIKKDDHRPKVDSFLTPASKKQLSDANKPRGLEGIRSIEALDRRKKATHDGSVQELDEPEKPPNTLVVFVRKRNNKKRLTQTRFRVARLERVRRRVEASLASQSGAQKHSTTAKRPQIYFKSLYPS